MYVEKLYDLFTENNMFTKNKKFLFLLYMQILIIIY